MLRTVGFATCAPYTSLSSCQNQKINRQRKFLHLWRSPWAEHDLRVDWFRAGVRARLPACVIAC
jgi:hypothetical protein